MTVYEMTNANGFEIQTCTRCGGCGQYSYNQITGTRCFGCEGTGKQFTKRGYSAFKFYRDLCQIDINAVQPGDRIQLGNGGAKFTVAEVLPPYVGGYRGNKDGTTTPILTHDFKSVHGNVYGIGGASTVRLIPQGDRKAELLAQAHAYQDSLTAAGKPRKRQQAA